MSVKSELNNTKYYLRESRKAILGRGGEISEKAGLKDIPEAVWSIPADTSLAFREDSEVAYEKVVPVGAEEYARVKSLGGMSYKQVSANLCKADGYYNLSEITAKQLAETDYPHENRIDLDFGELDEGVYHLKVYGNYDNFHGITGSLGCDYSGNLDQGYDYNKHDFAFIVAKKTQVRIQLGSNYNYDFSAIDETEPENIPNYCFYGEITGIMLVKISDEVPEDTWGFLNSLVLDTSLAYEPYHPPMLVSAKPKRIESRGANLLNMHCPEGLPSDTTDGTDKKRIFEHNTLIVGMSRTNYFRPNSVSLEGRTANSFTFKAINYGYNISFALKLKPNTQYFVSYESDKAPTPSYAFYADDGTWQSANVPKGTLKAYTFTTDNYGNVVIGFTMTAGESVTVSNIMVTEGTEAVPYKPYSAEPIDTKALPEAVQSLDGWGLGIDAEYNNHIEWRDGRIIYVQMCAEGRLDETLGWRAYTANQYPEGVYCYYVTNAKPNGKVGYQTSICSHFNNVNGVWGASTGTVGDYSDHSSYSWIYVKTDKATVEEWKSYLATNDVRLVYELAEPIETDITYLFTDTSPFLKVQGGGGVIANNERKEAVPFTLKYTIKVG